MTGCIGSEDVEFTILSEHAPETGLFKWKIDGNVEVIEHPFKVIIHPDWLWYYIGMHFSAILFH